MSSLQIFNTFSGTKETFVPLHGNTVKIYACGPTVYDSSHLGHARMFIVWDVIQRYLRHLGYEVIFVRNITDVEDKIINRATSMGISPGQLSRYYTYEFWHDMYMLNVMQPDFEPKATEFIPEMIDFIQQLIEKGHAYEVGGDVYFNVSSFSAYGKLSKQNLDQLIVGAREQVKSQGDLKSVKKTPVDFALWKSSPESDPGWLSPWGHGRPGWHLECSTMIKKVLGDSIDIHGGGEDLVFPHHENEIAQSESLLEKPLAKYWLHNSFVQLNSEKMSKSLGNFSSIKDILKKVTPDALRLLLLQTQYRNPIDFTEESLMAARTAMNRLTKAAALAGEENALKESANGDEPELASPSVAKIISSTEQDFSDAMNNDFNTAVAISVLFTLADAITAAKDLTDVTALRDALIKLSKILGFTLKDTRTELDTDTARGIMDLLLDIRKGAREKKDYATSDLIRKKLVSLGINVMDAPEGATWEKL